jgi:hypothetical protein
MAWFRSVDSVVFLLFFCSFFKARHCCTKSNCTSQNSFVRCHEEAQCLKLHWTQVYPYAYLNETDPTTPHGIVIGKCIRGISMWPVLVESTAKTPHKNPLERWLPVQTKPTSACSKKIWASLNSIQCYPTSFNIVPTC